VFKADGLVYHSTLGWRVIKKNKKMESLEPCSSVKDRIGYAASERRGNNVEGFMEPGR